MSPWDCSYRHAITHLLIFLTSCHISQFTEHAQKYLLDTYLDIHWKLTFCWLKTYIRSSWTRFFQSSDMYVMACSKKVTTYSLAYPKSICIGRKRILFCSLVDEQSQYERGWEKEKCVKISLRNINKQGQHSLRLVPNNAFQWCVSSPIVWRVNFIGRHVSLEKNKQSVSCRRVEVIQDGFVWLASFFKMSNLPTTFLTHSQRVCRLYKALFALARREEWPDK